METNKAIKLMKVLVLIAGIIFLFTFISFERDNCGMCSFDNKGIESFMREYSNECLSYKQEIGNIFEYSPTDKYTETPN